MIHNFPINLLIKIQYWIKVNHHLIMILIKNRLITTSYKTIRTILKERESFSIGTFKKLSKNNKNYLIKNFKNNKGYWKERY